MWILRASEAGGSLTFRLANGSARTLGRAPTADFILDVAGFRQPDEYRHALTPGGDYIPIGHAHYNDRVRPVFGDIPRFALLLVKVILDPDKRKRFKIPKKPEVMEVFRDLLATGKLTPVIGQTFALHDVAAAMRFMQEGNVGRAIITP